MTVGSSWGIIVVAKQTPMPRSFPMTTIADVGEAMQTVLTRVADTAATATRFVQRESKLGGAEFVQTLVFGWLANAEATLEDLAQTAATLGVTISPQGLDQRFTRQAAECLQQVLAHAVTVLIAADPVAIPLLQRFQGVYLLDSSTIQLPDALQAVWPGCGGNTPTHTSAALKFQVRLNVTTGQLDGPLLQLARENDASAPLQTAPLPTGALRLADLGYFSLDVLRDMAAAGVYWLSRLQAGTAVYTANGQRCEKIGAWLAQQGERLIDQPIQLGVAHRLPCRLLAVRVPQAVADQRRRRLQAEGRRRGKTVTQRCLALADWTVLLTNLPPDKLSVHEAFVLARLRWQIELLFKLWKSEGHLDETRAERPARVQCEVYAKLLALICAHWLMLVSCWSERSSSPTRLMRTIRTHGQLLVEALGGSVGDIERVLDDLVQRLRATRPMTRRKTHPNAFDALVHVTDTP